MDKPRMPAPTTTFAHHQQLRQARYDAIKATIPAAPWAQLTRIQRQIVERYIDLALASVGRRGLARVVWPWTRRPGTETRAPRGRLSNPTALR